MKLGRGHWAGLAGMTFAVLLVIGLFATPLFDTVTPPAQRRPAAPVHPGPRTVVALGDSVLSGEGAGSYLPGTDGRAGNFCHRSRTAEITELRLTGTQRAVNLACSGAPAEQVGLGSVTQYGEGSQAARLAQLARHNHITTILVSAGANDEPQFGNTIADCFRQWITRGTGCTVGFDAEWHRRVNAMVPKLTAALRDVRQVMRTAGYPDGDYQLVVQSYAAPVGPGVPPGLLGLAGCPFQDNDLRWFSGPGVRILADGMHTAANRVGARFLDLSNAATGHQACTGGADLGKEWFTRLSVQWQNLTDPQRAAHALQASFHPNATGHARFAGCLRRFLGTDDPSATCVSGRDGLLHPTPTATG